MVIAIGLIILLLIVGISIYITTRIHKFLFINHLKEVNQFASWFIAAIPMIVTIGITFTGRITLLIFMFHLALAFSVCDGIRYLIKKRHHTIRKPYYAGIVAILLTISYFGYGYYNVHHIVETDYTINSSKITNGNSIRIAQITDTHIGNTFDGKKFGDYLSMISRTNPDVIVLTGDFVDERTTRENMIEACKKLGQAKSKYGTYVIFGNHDFNNYGGNDNYTSDELISCLKENGINILQDEAVLIDNSFYLIGRQDYSVKNRKSITELLNGVDTNKYVVVLDHQPMEYEQTAQTQVDLVLSGHTHAGQLFPGKFIVDHLSRNDMAYGKKQMKDTTFIVSSGLSGWGVPIKTGAKAEYVIIDVVK